MPALKTLLLTRTRRLYLTIIIPLLLLILLIYFMIGFQTFSAERKRMTAITELFSMKISQVFREIEDVFNPELENLLSEEFKTGYDTAAINRIRERLLELEYDTLEIDTINYYRFDPENTIYDTDFEPDMGLSFPGWSFFNETIRESEIGTVFLKAMTREGETGLTRLYAYVSMPDHEIFEIGIRFMDLHDLITLLGKETFNNNLISIRIFEDFDEEENDWLDEAAERDESLFKLHTPWSGSYYISQDSEYGRYNIIIDIEVRFVAFIVLSIVLLLVVCILFLYILKMGVSKLSLLLTAPIAILENNMKFFSVNKEDYYVENVKTNVSELESMHESFVRMKEDIVNSYDELNAINEELEDAYQENQDLIEKVDNLINIPDFLKYINNSEEFILKSFEKICSLIHDSEYAFAAIVEDGIYKYIDFRGFDINIMNELKMRVSDYSHAEEVILKDYAKNEFILDHNVPPINDRLSEIRQMIAIPIKSKENFIGLISFFSIHEGEFLSDDLRIATYFSNYIKGYLTINELSELEKDVQKETILGIIKLLEKHDPYTKGHSENVAKLAASFAEFLELDEKNVQDIYWAGIVHDIGKIIIPHNILNKPSRLTEQEFERIKKHPEYAYEVLKENKHMNAIAKTIRHHHERFDGTGYPDTLSGTDIPYESRILTIADSWDAMTSERVYKKGMPTADAIVELKKFSGKQFDPTLVKEWIEFVNCREKNEVKK